VDFYILAEAEPQQRLRFACRLVEKAFKLGHQIYLHAADAGQAQALDALLWQFQPSSFVPHALAADAADEPAPVLIGWQAPPAACHDVLINTALQVPAQFDRFARVTEIVVQEPAVLQATRTAWRFYLERGCALQRHDLRRAQ
jgi:DNA polymerase-3 subunit chi